MATLATLQPPLPWSRSRRCPHPSRRPHPQTDGRAGADHRGAFRVREVLPIGCRGVASRSSLRGGGRQHNKKGRRREATATNQTASIPESVSCKALKPLAPADRAAARQASEPSSRRAPGRPGLARLGCQTGDEPLEPAEPCAPPAVSRTPRGLAVVRCPSGGRRWPRPNAQAQRERAQKDCRRTRAAGRARAGGWTHVGVGQARAPPLGSTHPRLL